MPCFLPPLFTSFTNAATRQGSEPFYPKTGNGHLPIGLERMLEHVFGVIKRLWGFARMRYRGLPRNATRVFTALALALANVYLSRQRLMAQVHP